MHQQPYGFFGVLFFFFFRCRLGNFVVFFHLTDAPKMGESRGMRTLPSDRMLSMGYYYDQQGGGVLGLTFLPKLQSWEHLGRRDVQ